MRTENNGSPMLTGDGLKPYYRELNKEILLVIPSFRVKAKVLLDVNYKIFRDGVLTYKKKIRPHRSGSCFETDEQRIPLTKLNLKNTDINLQVKIDFGLTNIYSSQKRLWRDFILFHNGHEITEGQAAVGSYYLYARNVNVFSQIPQFQATSFKNLYLLQPLNGEKLKNVNRSITFGKPARVDSYKTQRSTAAFEKQKVYKPVAFQRTEPFPAKLWYQGQKYSLITGELCLNFDLDSDLSNYKLCYGDFSFPLSYFVCQNLMTCPLHRSDKKVSIKVPLEDFAPTEIELYNSLEKKVEDHIRVVKCPGLNIALDKEIYSAADTFAEVNVSLGTESAKRQFLVSEGEPELDWSKIVHGREGSLRISLPVVQIKMGDGNFDQKFKNSFWYQDIPEEALFSISLNTSLYYDVVDDMNTRLSPVSKDTYCLGKHIHTGCANRSRVTFYIRLANGKKSELFTVMQKARFKSDPFILDGRNFSWNPADQFIGPANPTFIVDFKRDGNVRKTITLSKEKRELLIEGLKSGKYLCSVQLKDEDKEPLLEKEVLIGNKSELRFKDSTLKISRAQLVKKSKWKEIEPFYIDQIKYAGKVNGLDVYTGEVFIKLKSKKHYLDRMEGDDGEFEKTNPVRLDLLDDKNCTLLSGVNPENLDEFLGEFTLDEEGEISNLTDKSKVKYIQRYEFEEVSED